MAIGVDSGFKSLMAAQTITVSGGSAETVDSAVLNVQLATEVVFWIKLDAASVGGAQWTLKTRMLQGAFMDIDTEDGRGAATAFEAGDEFIIVFPIAPAWVSSSGAMTMDYDAGTTTWTNAILTGVNNVPFLEEVKLEIVTDTTNGNYIVDAGLLIRG